MAEGTFRYGDFYYCVKTDISPDGEIYVTADKTEVLPDGTVLFLHSHALGDRVNLAIASGRWSSFYGAAVLDGAPVAVEHWQGEVDRRPDTDDEYT